MQLDAPPTTVKKQAGWKTAAGLLLFVLLVAIFAWQIHKDWPAIAGYTWQVSWTPAALAFLLLLACSWMDILIWNTTLGWFTEKLPFARVTAVYIWSYLARYIPAKVGSLLLRTALGVEAGRGVVPVLTSSFIELALRTAGALFISLLILLGWKSAYGHHLLHVSCCAIPVVLLCAHPRIMLPVLNWGLRKINRPVITQSLRYREVLGIFLALLFRWVFFGLAFFLLACAIYPPAIHNLLTLIGTAAGSWALGFGSGSPGGLGMMEWTQRQVLLNALHYQTSIADVLPVLFRLWTLFAEGLWALAAWFLYRTWSRRTSPDTVV